MSEYVIINGDRIKVPDEVRAKCKGRDRAAIAKWVEDKTRASEKVFSKPKAPPPAEKE